MTVKITDKILCNFHILCSLGPGSAVGGKSKKRGEIGKISASEASPAVSRGDLGSRTSFLLPILPLGSFPSPTFFFSQTPIFYFFSPQCGAWSLVISCTKICVTSTSCVNILNMPLTLRQLENCSDNCIEKIQEFRAMADSRSRLLLLIELVVQNWEIYHLTRVDFLLVWWRWVKNKSKHFCRSFHNSQEFLSRRSLRTSSPNWASERRSREGPG